MKTRLIGALAVSLAMFGVLTVGGAGSVISSAHAQSPDDFGSQGFDGESEDHHEGGVIIHDSFVIIINCGDYVPCIVFGLDGFPLSAEAMGEAPIATDDAIEGEATVDDDAVTDDSMDDPEMSSIDDTSDTESDATAGTDDVDDGETPAMDATGDVEMDATADDGATDDAAADEGETIDATEDVDAGVTADDDTSPVGDDEREWTRTGPR